MQHEPKGRLLGQRGDGELFSTRKIERVHRRRYTSRGKVRADVFDSSTSTIRGVDTQRN